MKIEELQKTAYHLMMLVMQSSLNDDQEVHDIITSLLENTDFKEFKIKVE